VTGMAYDKANVLTQLNMRYCLSVPTTVTLCLKFCYTDCFMSQTHHAMSDRVGPHNAVMGIHMISVIP